jgi:hypothetical protein
MARLISVLRVLAPVALLTIVLAQASAQSTSFSLSNADSGHEVSWDHASSSDGGFDPDGSSLPEGAFPAEPEPAVAAGGFDHYSVAPAAYWHQRPLSRIGFGADVSLLGIGFKSALELSQNFDIRVLGNYFSYPNADFKVDGFDVNGDIHLASASTSLDWYPFGNGTIFRVSPGVMFYNQNHLGAKGGISGGSSFSLGSTTYYSANANPATGATPLTGTGDLGFHRNRPAFLATAGFGNFVPRSNRHWSFPSEFGVVFMGAPTVDLNLSGWACTDARQTQCANVADPHSPIAIEFNQNLQSRIQHWRNEAGKVTVYPVFSYSVMYSFNIR